MKRKVDKNLAEWRAKHFGELETCLTVAKGIRDDPEAGAKNRVEAVKIIARLLDALKPEKGESHTRLVTDNKKAQLDPEHEKRLNAILAKFG